jgi:hypothetical protein
MIKCWQQPDVLSLRPCTIDSWVIKLSHFINQGNIALNEKDRKEFYRRHSLALWSSMKVGLLYDRCPFSVTGLLPLGLHFL